MKIVILLFTFMVLLNLTSAALGNAGRTRMYPGEYADFDIPLRSQVFVQTPDDRVFINTSPFLNQNQFPTWVIRGGRADNDEGHVYVRMYGDNRLITDLVPLHNYARNYQAYGYHCYILLPNEILLHAHLQPGIHAGYFLRPTSVFVRIPGEYNSTYSGLLEHYRGYRPLWLTHDSSIHRSGN